MIDFSFLDSIKGDLYKFIGILILFELTLTFFDFLKKAADNRLEKKFYKSLSDAEKKYYDRVKRTTEISTVARHSGRKKARKRRF